MNIREAAEYYLMHILGYEERDKQGLLSRVRSSMDVNDPVYKGELSNLVYWDVEGMAGVYRVITNGSSYPTCTCPDWQHRFRTSTLKEEVLPTPCKHGLRVLLRKYGEIYVAKGASENGNSVHSRINE
jgi:hypothetical protein|tara:strand:- start:315 stop:698 length:384 start_codon:yes stop_codon:yes gene_type:complete